MKHGSGQACYKTHTNPACEECRAYRRARAAAERKVPGTYRYGLVHGTTLAAERFNDYRRYRNRAARIARDAAKLEGMRWQS